MVTLCYKERGCSIKSRVKFFRPRIFTYHQPARISSARFQYKAPHSSIRSINDNHTMECQS